jgi:hypothetical protein
MAMKFTEQAMKETLAQFLESGENLIAAGWAAEKGTRYFYVALTDRRILLVRLSMTYKVKGDESIPFSQLEAYSLHEGFKIAPIDVQMISRMAETSLYLKPTSGKKRALRFSAILGYPNKEVPLQIVEALDGMRQGAQ